MKWHPILMSDESMRAILAGRKTQTRRVIRDVTSRATQVSQGATPGIWAITYPATDLYPECVMYRRCPYGVVGDRLWVKEGWRVDMWGECGDEFQFQYRADGALSAWLSDPDPEYHANELSLRLWEQSSIDAAKAGMKADDEGNYHWEPGQGPCRWRSPIFMPRWASRLSLENTEIRAQQIQDITGEDAEAEGVDVVGSMPLIPSPDLDIDALATMVGRRLYAPLWDSLNAKRGYPWVANDWVRAITFEVVT